MVTVIAVILLVRSMSFSWLIRPSDALTATAELDCDIALFVTTLLALVFVIAEYAAEHLDWPWGASKKHLFAVGVIIGFSGELLSEIGSFWYSYSLQYSQAETIKDLGRIAEKAKVDASAASTAASNATTTANSAIDRANKASGRLDVLGPRLATAETHETELERAISPPIFDERLLAKAMMPFRRSNVFISTYSSTDSETLTGEIERAAIRAGMGIPEIGPTPEMSEGIVLEIAKGASADSVNLLKAMCLDLKAQKIPVSWGLYDLASVPKSSFSGSEFSALGAGGIVVRVGPPSNMYFVRKLMRASGMPLSGAKDLFNCP